MKHLLLFLLPLVLFTTCDDDDDLRAPGEVPLTMDFKAEFADRDLSVQAATYDYPLEDVRLKTTLFQYYVSDLTLLGADGTETALTEIDLIRYESEGDGATVSRQYTVPAGDYRGLRFGLGVKPELNARNPNEFAADFVLNENEFWNPNARYVFAKIEANADLENDGTFDTGLTYHMGADNLYRLITFTGDFTLAASDPNRLTLVADLLEVFTAGGVPFDVTDPDRQRVHGGNQPVATDLWDGLAGQFELIVR